MNCITREVLSLIPSLQGSLCDLKEWVQSYDAKNTVMKGKQANQNSTKSQSFMLWWVLAIKRTQSMGENCNCDVSVKGLVSRTYDLRNWDLSLVPSPSSNKWEPTHAWGPAVYETFTVSKSMSKSEHAWQRWGRSGATAVGRRFSTRRWKVPDNKTNKKEEINF